MSNRVSRRQSAGDVAVAWSDRATPRTGRPRPQRWPRPAGPPSVRVQVPLPADRPPQVVNVIEEDVVDAAQPRSPHWRGTAMLTMNSGLGTAPGPGPGPRNAGRPPATGVEVMTRSATSSAAAMSSSPMASVATLSGGGVEKDLKANGAFFNYRYA